MSDRCPKLVNGEESNFYPDHTCKCIWNYCMHLGHYEDCDIYKRHKRIVEQFRSMFKEVGNDTTNSN